jgi:outer membrane protein TolC
MILIKVMQAIAVFTVVTTALAAPKTLEEVLQSRLSTASEFTSDLDKVASRNRVRAWLPTSPQVSYTNSDNNTWKSWTISTKFPIPFKALYRDEAEVRRRGYLQAQNSFTKQELLRETIEIYLECSVPTEMAHLMEQAWGDQKVVSSISNSLYAAGSVPQADRVAAELLARQLEAQVRMHRDQGTNACIRWEKWADEDNREEDPGYVVPNNVSDQVLTNLGLSSDRYRDMTNLKLLSISIDKEKLWSKYVPDLDLSWSRNNYFNLIKSGGPPIKFTQTWMVGITIPITFPFYDNTEYRQERSELGLDKMDAELEKNHSEKKWLQAKNDWMRASSRLKEIWGKDLALAEVLVESSLASYRAGKVGYADLVLARRTKLDLKVEEVQLKAQRLIAKSVCLTECEK